MNDKIHEVSAVRASDSLGSSAPGCKAGTSPLGRGRYSIRGYCLGIGLNCCHRFPSHYGLT